MKRRAYLATAAVGVGSAGCVGRASNTDSGSNSNNSDGDQETGQNSTVTVEDQMESGEQITIDSGLSLTAANQTLTDEASTTELDIVTEEVGNRLAFVEFTARNDADEPINFPRRDEIAMVVDGQQYPAHRSFRGGLTSPITGEWYETIEQARSGVETSGWLLFEVPGNTDMGRLSWSRRLLVGEDEYMTAEWDLPFEPDELPNFDVTRFDLPETAVPYSTIEAKIEVQNSGGDSGTFEAEVTGEEIDEPIEISESIPPRETQTTSVFIPYPDSLVDTPFETTYELGPVTRVVRYESPILNEGEWFEHPEGYNMQVSSVQFADQIEYRNVVDEVTALDSGQGLQYLIFQLTTENRTSDDGRRVRPRQFTVVDDRDLNPETVLGIGDEMVSPVSGSQYRPEVHMPNESLNGWIVFEVSESLSNDAAIQFGELDYEDLKPAWSV